jgi:hypothetical protein
MLAGNTLYKNLTNESADAFLNQIHCRQAPAEGNGK